MRPAFIKKYIKPKVEVNFSGVIIRVLEEGYYEDTFTVPVTFLEFSHHYQNDRYSRVAIVEMENGTI
jgi:hypothetical protein